MIIKKDEGSSMSSAERLSTAIIIQAANDYRDARAVIHKYESKYPRNKADAIRISMQNRRQFERERHKELFHSLETFNFVKTDDEKISEKVHDAYDTIAEVEEFFHSKWYSFLSQIDGDYMIHMLKSEPITKKVKHTDYLLGFGSE